MNYGMSPWQDPMIDRLSHFLDLNVLRGSLIISNMANVDTPGYHAFDINFRRALENADAATGLTPFRPAVQVVQGLPIRPDGNDVSLERESLLLAETQIRFNAGVQLLRDYFKTLLSAIHEGSAS